MLKLVLGVAVLVAATYACKDGHSSCPRWTKFCSSNSYVKKYCLKSCGKCSQTAAPPTQAPPTSGGSSSYGECGVTPVPQSRIVNGDEAKEGAWPWIVSLQTSGGFHFCGGSILTPTWILTASHCVDSRKNSPTSMRVVAGAHNIKSREGTQQKMTPKRIIMHQSYGVGGFLNADIALIELSSPLRLNSRVVRACVPQQGVYPKVGAQCYIAGWGRISYNPRRSPEKLQQAKLPIMNNKGKEQVIAGHGVQGKANACQGDSGGPLMCLKSDGKSWQVEGAASYVYRGCYGISAYSPLNKYLSWVKRYVPNL